MFRSIFSLRRDMGIDVLSHDSSVWDALPESAKSHVKECGYTVCCTSAAMDIEPTLMAVVMDGLTNSQVLLITSKCLGLPDAAIMELLYHEGQHFEQIRQGRLEINVLSPYLVKWEGVEYDYSDSKIDFKEYFNRPWELEAYEVSIRKTLTYGGYKLEEITDEKVVECYKSLMRKFGLAFPGDAAYEEHKALKVDGAH